MCGFTSKTKELAYFVPAMLGLYAMHEQEDKFTSGNPKYTHVYAEGSSWVRMINEITWKMASVILPISISCIGLAVKFPNLVEFFLFLSLVMFGSWVYLALYYGSTAAEVRSTLIEIEKEWQIDTDKGFYQKQGNIWKRKYGAQTFLRTVSTLFIVGWAYVLIKVLF